MPLNLGGGALNIKKIVKVEKEAEAVPVTVAKPKIESEEVKVEKVKAEEHVEKEQDVEDAGIVEKEEKIENAESGIIAESQAPMLPPKPKAALSAQLQVVNLEVEVTKAPVVETVPESAEVVEEEDLIPPAKNVDYVSILLKNHQLQLENEKQKE